jgi:predicted anti-sigma-YlaC factor YlaD
VLLRNECRRHREALIAFLARAEPGERPQAALDHLDRCERCEAEMGQTALAIAALRRLFEDARVAEPPAVVWPRLREQVERPTRQRFRTMLAAPLAGAALVALLVAPIAVDPHLNSTVLREQPIPVLTGAARQRALEAQISASRPAWAPPPQIAIAAPPVTWLRPGADGRRPFVAREPQRQVDHRI